VTLQPGPNGLANNEKPKTRETLNSSGNSANPDNSQQLGDPTNLSPNSSMITTEPVNKEKK